MSKRIQTCDEFETALQRVRFARDRIPELKWMVTTREMPGRSYDLWHQSLHIVHEAIGEHDWSAVGELLRIYDLVQLAGERGEMWEASYVAFLEDVCLPLEPADLRKFWQACPANFLREIQCDRGIQRGR